MGLEEAQRWLGRRTCSRFQWLDTVAPSKLVAAMGFVVDRSGDQVLAGPFSTTARFQESVQTTAEI